jgi:DNA-binding transcriptional LysR family regulator
LRLCDSDAKDLRARLIDGDLELVVYALPGEEPDERTHVIPLFRERMVIAVGLGHRLANQRTVRVKDISGENYIHRNNCEFAGYADAILAEQGVTCNPTYWSDRDDWTLAMAAAGLGFGFMPEHSAKHPGVAALDRRARILAPGQSRQHSRAPSFAGGRRDRARSHAEEMVRRTGDGDAAGCRMTITAERLLLDGR